MVLLNLCNKASWIWTEKVTLIVHLTTIYIYIYGKIELVCLPWKRPFPRYLLVFD